MSETIKTENPTVEQKVEVIEKTEKIIAETEVDSKDKRQEYDAQEVNTKVTPSQK
jgi:hypothetical protein